MVSCEENYGNRITGIDVLVGASSTIFQIEIRQTLQHFVQRLLLIFISLSDAKHLMCAEFANLVPLEHVVLSHPAQLPRRVFAHAAYLKASARIKGNARAERNAIRLFAFVPGRSIGL